MHISQAQTFLAIIETGNLNRAAEKLNVTQSTVTTRINALEDSLGQKLLVRSRSGAQLTSAGFKFQRHAEILVEAWRQARLETALPSGFQATCNIACQFDAWHGAGELMCKALRRDFPGVAVSVWPGEHGDIQRWLSSGMVDVALVFDMPRQTRYHRRDIFDDLLIEVATSPRPLQRWDPAYVYIDHGAEFRRQHAAAFPVEETASVTFGSSTWALEYLLSHSGSGYLPLRLLGDHLARGSLHVVEGAPTFSRPCSLAFNLDVTRGWPWFSQWCTTTSQQIVEELRAVRACLPVELQGDLG